MTTMRPIERGDVPLDDHGSPKVFGEYPEARQDLIDRMGEYCSYCEMHLDASLAVEHIKPKKANPAFELDWSNFLLSCTNCNSIKGGDDLDVNDYYWPDRHNTAQALEYGEGGIVQVNPALTQAQQDRAERTIKLTGLERQPNNSGTASNRRWNNRREAWDIATLSRQDLAAAPIDGMRRQIVRTARANGFWSVWMTVFHDDETMRERLIVAFAGTCRDCFDDHFRLVDRPNGAL
jgi:uncharacterized protein (TIGR02646 family)